MESLLQLFNYFTPATDAAEKPKVPDLSQEDVRVMLKDTRHLKKPDAYKSINSSQLSLTIN